MNRTQILLAQPQVVRRAGPGDTTTLTGLLANLSPDDYFWRFLTGRGGPAPAWMLARLLDDGDGRRGAWFALDQTSAIAVGHACWTLSPGDVADIGAFVLGDRQQQGLGQALVRAAVTEAAAAGARQARFDVHPGNRLIAASLRSRLAPHRAVLVDGLLRWQVPVGVVLAS